MLLTFLKERKIAPAVAARFALEDAADAHELMTKKNNPGKFVIVGQQWPAQAGSQTRSQR